MKYDHKQSIKEVAKHALLRVGLTRVLDALRTRRGLTVGHTQQRDIPEIFSSIYASGAWVMSKDQDTLSGAGSTHAATNEIVGRVSALLKRLGCRRLVDVGCGDFNWMRMVEGDFNYLGIDVVPQLVAANNATYGNERRRFICMDAVREPISPGDVAICREVLFHLSFRDGLSVLRNIKAAGFKYVLLTSDKAIWFNSDIRNGDYRRINLAKPPFALPPPDFEFADDKVAEGRVLAVWPGAVLPG